MKQISLFLLVFMLVSFKLTASELRFINNHLSQDRKISLSYTTDARFYNVPFVNAYIYFFKNSNYDPFGIDATLRKKEIEHIFLGDFIVEDKVDFVLIKVGDSENMDDFNGRYYKFFLQNDSLITLDNALLDENLKLSKNSYYTAALSVLGFLPENCRPNSEFKIAIKLLEKELKFYPENYLASIALLTTQFDLKMIDQDTFYSKVLNLIKSIDVVYDEPSAAAIIRGLRTIKQDNQANQVEKDFVKDHPESNLAENRLFEKLSKAVSFEDFIGLFKKFINKFPNSSNIERIYGALVESYFQTGDVINLENFINDFKDIPSKYYFYFAVNVLKNKDLDFEILFNGKTRYDIADKYFNKCLEVIDKGLDIRPKNYTPFEYSKIYNGYKATIYENLGDLFSETDSINKTIIYYEKSINLSSVNADDVLYEKIINNLLKINDLSKSIDYLQKAIINSKSNNYLDSIYIIYQKKLNETNPEKYFDINNLRNSAFNKRQNILKYSKMDMKSVLPVLKTLDNQTIDLSGYLGKVLVIECWSTWCQPCMESMAAIDSFYKKFKYSDSVMFFQVNLWEKSDQKQLVEKFIEQNKYEAPLYLDVNNTIPQLFGVSGLPVRIYIDKKGLVQFIDKGVTSEELIYSLIDDKIKFLLTN